MVVIDCGCVFIEGSVDDLCVSVVFICICCISDLDEMVIVCWSGVVGVLCEGGWLIVIIVVVELVVCCLLDVDSVLFELEVCCVGLVEVFSVFICFDIVI